MYEKDVLEKWLKQIQKGQLNPEAIGLGSDRDKAIENLKSKINKLSYNKPLVNIKQK